MLRLPNEPTRTFERVLVGLDSGASSAISRIVLGLCIPPVFHALFGDRDPVWMFPATFIVLLVALRVVPAVLRAVLPFSTDAKRVWAERRFLAKRYDSYQWQKLFWIGVGLLAHIVIAGGAQAGELLVTIICLVGGAGGLSLWRKVKVSDQL
jgi:hypothetical protein